MEQTWPALTQRAFWKLRGLNPKSCQVPLLQPSILELSSEPFFSSALPTALCCIQGVVSFTKQLKKKIASRMKNHQIHSCNVLKTFKSSPAFSLKLFLADSAVFGGRGKTPKSNTIKKCMQLSWLTFIINSVMWGKRATNSP